MVFQLCAIASAVIWSEGVSCVCALRLPVSAAAKDSYLASSCGASGEWGAEAEKRKRMTFGCWLLLGSPPRGRGTRWSVGGGPPRPPARRHGALREMRSRKVTYTQHNSPCVPGATRLAHKRPEFCVTVKRVDRHRRRNPIARMMEPLPVAHPALFIFYIIVIILFTRNYQSSSLFWYNSCCDINQ